jgi:hypothetical protein
VAAGGLDGGGVALQVTGNSVMQPEGRALHAVATAPVIVDANFFSSLGYHGFDGGTNDPVARSEQLAVVDVVFVENLGRPWESTPPDGGYPAGAVEPGNLIEYLTNDIRNSPRQFTGLSGTILFNNNQVLYSWDVQRPPLSGNPLSFFSALLISLDHITACKNHFSVRLKGETTFTPVEFTTTPLLADVFVGAATVEVMHNRLAEVIGKTTFSLITNADLLNITALNQSTHPVLVTSQTTNSTDFRLPYLLARDNQVLFQPNTVPFVSVRQFLRIMWFHQPPIIVP